MALRRRRGPLSDAGVIEVPPKTRARLPMPTPAAGTTLETRDDANDRRFVEAVVDREWARAFLALSMMLESVAVLDTRLLKMEYRAGHVLPESCNF